MPLKLSAQCPFLLEGDVLSLSSDFRLQKQLLLDTALGARHQLVAPGDTLVRALVPGMQYGNLITLAKHHGATVAQLREVLGFLNSVGGLRVWRKQHMRAAYAQAKDLLLGITHPRLAYRRSALPGTVLYGVLRACAVVVVAASASAFLLAAAGPVSFEQASGTAFVGLVLLIASVWVHEMAHVVTINRAGVQPVVMQTGLRVGLLHKPLSSKNDLISALVGPLAGLLVVTAAIIASIILDQPALAWVAAGTALLQLLSFLPTYGDGATIVKVIKKGRHEIA